VTSSTQVVVTGGGQATLAGVGMTARAAVADIAGHLEATQ
jgi:hypothetical protein